MIPLEVLIEGYRTMCLIRRAEEAIAEDFRTNKIFSFLHLSIGQEAVAAGVCLALGENDRVFGNHRSHGHYLAKGGDLYAMMAEVYGKADGCCKGKGGSMHMLDRSVGFAGSTPILGSAVPIAAGSAFEQKQRDVDEVSVVFFGDGASEEGVVYETINAAALMKLPLILIVENNLFAVNSPLTARRSEAYHLGAICSGLGVNYVSVDGNSFQNVYETLTEIREHTKWRGPTVIEARVFREMAHSGPIMDESVRQQDAKAERERQDPIARLRKVLEASGSSAKVLDIIDQGERLDVEKAMSLAKAAPMPKVSELMEGIYAR
jgi:TPP-dependent pyruvate/acetoin dehydrogenase alpha subunit